ncbi:apolipoprotein N-acyltransferase [Methyloversatilis thermotolerans]|uniref:apolipoprotein N-acyltransferase n=1 Tax=Methyloversatilis thermotolerans TaxID=1346290 RepID=UPI00036EBD4C|nr:apolipoprotein N-acyltransferase [Methyloversatilis thermotolerans]
MRRSVRAVLALVAGALAVGGFAPFGLFVLPLLALAALLWLLEAQTPRSAALIGFAFGLGGFLAGVSWVNVSLSQFGGMPLPLSLLATVLFCAYLALFPAAVCAAQRMLRPSALLSPWLFAALWVGGEWLRGTVFTGFPWLASGYAHTPPSPLAGYVPVFGVHGAGFAAAAMAGLLVVALQRRIAARSAMLWAGALLLTGVLLSRVGWTEASGRALTVSLLQGNIEQSMKWAPERLPDSMSAYLELARAWPADLVVLPETAIPLPYHEIDAGWLAALRATGRDVLMGAVTVGEVDGRPRYFNSALAVGDDGKRYSKAHLVPFGEFTPPLFAWTLQILSIPMSDFGRGAAVQPPLELAGERVAVNICYEDVFGEELIAAARDATLLVNVSNTAWFGESWAQPQHLQIAQMRALELGRPMLRATNTGMTAAIQPDGRVSAVLPPFMRAALRVSVQGHTGRTPFMRWGNAPVLLLALLVVIAAAVQRKRN